MARSLLTIHFVRHGESTANRESIIQGQQDYRLTPLGVNQAEATAARLQANKYWQVHSSDLVRASRTAEIITEKHDGTTVLKTPLLREFGLGVQEDLPRGTSWSEARRIKAEKAGVPLVDFKEPKRESLTEVEKRARQFVDALVADADGDTFMQGEAAEVRGLETEGRVPDKNEAEKEDGAGADGSRERLALVVSHGGLLNVMLSVVMGVEEVGFMGNCSVAVIKVFEKDEGGFSFVPGVLNDDSHMEAAGLSADGDGVENFGK